MSWSPFAAYSDKKKHFGVENDAEWKIVGAVFADGFLLATFDFCYVHLWKLSSKMSVHDFIQAFFVQESVSKDSDKWSRVDYANFSYKNSMSETLTAVGNANSS